MSEILVYVNEDLSCSVTVEDEDLTVESFWKNVLNVQVDDILNFPYKFTRSVNNKRLVVGVKQEAALKLTRCVESNTDEKAIYIVREEASPSVEESAATAPTVSGQEIPEESGEEKPTPVSL